MLAKPPACDGCPLRDKSQGFVPDQISPTERYRLIGEAPGKNEIVEGKPFVGQAGFVLREWLVKSVIPLRICYERGEVSVANTLRCLPPEIQGRAYPRGEERLLAEACCRRYDTPLPHGNTAVLFGDSPQRAWFRDELDKEDATDRSLGRDVKGVMGRIGRVYERDGSRFVFSPHPAFILRQPMLIGHAVEALKIAVGVNYVEPQVLPWADAMQVLR